MLNKLNFFSKFFRYLYILINIFFILAVLVNTNSVKAISKSGNVNVNANVVYVPQRIVFVTNPQILEKNEISSNYEIRVEDNYGHKVEVNQDIVIVLSSNSSTGEFSLTKNPFQNINTITIKAGKSEADFYYRDSQVGTHNISVSTNSLIGAFQQVTIVDTTPPAIPVILSPTNNAVITDTRTPTINGLGDPGSTIIVEIDDLSYSAIVDNSGNWQIIWPMQLENKSYKITALARDEYGNESKSISINITINIPSPPTPTPTPPIKKDLELDITANNIANKYLKEYFQQTKAVFSNNEMDLGITPSYDKEIKSVVGYFESVSYVMDDKNNDGKYEAKIIAPWYSGSYNLKVVVNYQDGQTEDIDVDILVDPFGFVYEINKGKQSKLSGAVITLYVYKDGKWQIWDGSKYNQVNPQISKEDGRYGFIVPEGLYYIEARKDGYSLFKSTTLQIRQGNPINIDILLNKIGIGGIIEDFGNYVRDFVGNIGLTLAPFVYNKTVQEVYAPANIVTGVTIASTAVATSILNLSLLSPLAQLLAKLLIFFGIMKRTKKPWGIVYDSESYNPVPMAVIQIVDRETNKVLETQITDDEGRFGFLVKSGEYFLNVIKKNYLYPSKVQHKDYHKETLKIKEDNAIININIPIDPEFSTLAKRAFSLSKVNNFLNNVKYVFLLIGTLLTLVFAIVQTNSTNVILFVIYILIWIYELYNFVNSAKGYSRVINNQTKQGVDLGIVRIFDQNNKLVGTKVTNINGNFNFLIKKGKHYLVITKDNYKQYRSKEIDFKRNTIVRKEFALQKS